MKPNDLNSNKTDSTLEVKERKKNLKLFKCFKLRIRSWIRSWIRIWIRIRTKVVQICNTAGAIIFFSFRKRIV